MISAELFHSELKFSEFIQVLDFQHMTKIKGLPKKNRVVNSTFYLMFVNL